MAAIVPVIAAAGSGGAVAGGAASLFTMGNVLTAVSVLSSVGSGIASLKEGKAAKQIAELNARTEELNSRKEALSVNEELIKTLARNNVAMAVGGIQSSGSAARAQESARKNANEELSVIKDNSLQAQSDTRLRGKQAATRGKVKLAGSLFEAAGDSYSKLKKVKGT